MLKVDLHTHSSASPDGGIRPDQYAHIINEGLLDYVAITDHNTIDQALKLHTSLGERIIVGEEINTRDGEIIGLFLTSPVAPGQSPLETAQAIHKQNGLVYIPHPFETLRSGLPESSLHVIQKEIDIIEVHNGRAVFQNKGPQAATWARLHNLAMAASSDAHGLKGVGSTLTILASAPTFENLVELLAHAQFMASRPPLRTLLYPKAHRLGKKVRWER